MDKELKELLEQLDKKLKKMEDHLNEIEGFIIGFGNGDLKPKKGLW